MGKAARILAAALMLGMPVDGVASQSPRIAKPSAAPPVGPSDVLPLPPAQIDNSLAVAGSDVKAREVNSRLSVDVRLNGRGPYRFVIDSGADSSAVGLRIARELHLPIGSRAILNGTTSRDVVDRVQVRELTLGSSTVHDLELPALREEDLGTQGLIGIDALAGHRLMLDFEAHLIRIEDARTPVKSIPGEIVITARRRHGQLILTRVRAGPVVLDAVIDTGSEFTIGNSALRDQLLGKGTTAASTMRGVGVTGVPALFQVASIEELRIGQVILRNVPVAFADVPPFKLFGISDQPALLLGTDVLSAFRRVALDFRSRRVRFQLRRCTTQGVATAADNGFMRISPDGNGQTCAR